MSLISWARLRWMRPRNRDRNMRPCAASCGDAQSRAENIRIRGEWGESVAAEHLKGRGWRIIGRRVRPCARDRRCEIDIIARTRHGGVVFVEVKTHRTRSPYATRLWRVDRRKKENLLRACASWIMLRKWHGNFRFDVIEIFGSPESGAPEIDHIENVPLFPSKWRFW